MILERHDDAFTYLSYIHQSACDAGAAFVKAILFFFARPLSNVLV
jgi:hypothetical protein